MSLVAPQNLIDVEKLIGDKNPKLIKWLPRFLINYLKKIIHQEEVNQFIADHGAEDSFTFTRSLSNKFNLNVTITGLENLPKDGGAIAVSNHPLGGLDAMALLPKIEHIRKDVKYIVNDLLLHIPALRQIFVGINKHGPNARENLREIDQVFASDQLVMLFPSGLVSRKQKGILTDMPWQKTFVTKAKQYNKPIIPIYTEGELTPFFYRLSNIRKFFGIKANIEMLYLSDEMFRQKGKAIHYIIGKPINVNEFDENLKDIEISLMIRKELYNLAATN